MNAPDEFSFHVGLLFVAGERYFRKRCARYSTPDLLAVALQSTSQENVDTGDMADDIAALNSRDKLAPQ
jgi:hypothetical protein